MRAQCTNEFGLHGWRGGILGFVWEVKLMCDLMYQTNSWFHIPVQIPGPAGDRGVIISGSYVSKLLQLQLWFFRLSNPIRAKWVRPFFLPWSDSIVRVRLELPSLYCRQQKRQTEKCFLLIMTVTTLIIFLDNSPPIQEQRHCLIFVGTRTSIAKFDVNDGVSLSIP